MRDVNKPVTNFNKGIIDKALMPYDELKCLEELLSNLMQSLETCSKDSDYNFFREIGKYAREMPRFSIYIEHADQVKKLVRRVCTGEISPSDALENLKNFKPFVETALKLFDEKAVWSAKHIALVVTENNPNK